MWFSRALFLVLFAGALLCTWRTARDTGFLGEDLALPSAGHYTLKGEPITGYDYLGSTARFLLEEAPVEMPVYALGDVADAGFWLSYLAYPRLVQFLPIPYAKHTLSRLPPGRYGFVVLPPAPVSREDARLWKAEKVAYQLETMLGQGEVTPLFEAALGPLVFEGYK
jgi:hypothetical protein